jgi:hypothetical protein
MYVVQRADDLSFLSSIEFVWCTGKKCKVVGTRHVRVLECIETHHFQNGILLLSMVRRHKLDLNLL